MANNSPESQKVVRAGDRCLLVLKPEFVKNVVKSAPKYPKLVLKVLISLFYHVVPMKFALWGPLD